MGPLKAKRVVSERENGSKDSLLYVESEKSEEVNAFVNVEVEIKHR